MGSNLTELESYTANVVGPDAGNAVTAASVRVMGTSLANRTKYLKAVVSDGAHDINVKDIDAVNVECDEVDANNLVAVAILQAGGVQSFGGTMTSSSVSTCSGAWTFNASVTCNAAVSMTSTCTVSSAGTLIVLGRTRRRARVVLSDANQTIDTGQGDCFELPGAPAATRTIKLRTSTAPIPAANELIELIVPSSGLATATLYSIQREDTTVICTFLGALLTAASITARFEFDGGVWRLGMNSGRALDASSNHYGVLPGAGA